MDLPKAPDHGDLHAAGGVWNYIVFFVGLLLSGGLIEYLLSSRYVTKKEWKEGQATCTRHLQDQFELALLKNNERLEERMAEVLTKSMNTDLSNIVANAVAEGLKQGEKK